MIGSRRPRINEVIVESAKESILGPIDHSIQDQCRLLQQIKSDLRQTEAEQQDTRNRLAEQEERMAALQERYEDLMADIEGIAG